MLSGGFHMNEKEIKYMVDQQRSFFDTGATLPVSARLNALKKIRASIKKHEADIHRALQEDLGKSDFESYMCETGLTLSEISYMIHHLSAYAKEKRVHTPLAQFPSRSFQKPSPYGVVLVMSPWNYPFYIEHGTSDRCSGCWKHSHSETQRLLSSHIPYGSAYRPGMF